MPDAYAIYDKETMKVTKISWKPTDDLFVVIDKEDAKNFILGVWKINDYVVQITDDKKELIKVSNLIANVVTWSSLKNIKEENHAFDISILHDKIKIYTKQSKISYFLYAALKDDPSWLISSWYIGADEIYTVIVIDFPNAQNCSYFLRKV